MDQRVLIFYKRYYTKAFVIKIFDTWQETSRFIFSKNVWMKITRIKSKFELYDFDFHE